MMKAKKLNFFVCWFTDVQVCQRIPRSVLERVYGLRLPPPAEGENPARCPTAQELLSAYGCGCGLVCVCVLCPSSYHSCLSDLHGYMTSHGLPDCPRSARYILKDYVKVSEKGVKSALPPPPSVSQGKLLFCHLPPPPGIIPETFNPILTEPRPPAGELEAVVGGGSEEGVNPRPTGCERDGETETVTLSEFDRQFLKQVRLDPNLLLGQTGFCGSETGRGEGHLQGLPWSQWVHQEIRSQSSLFVRRGAGEGGGRGSVRYSKCDKFSVGCRETMETASQQEQEGKNTSHNSHRLILKSDYDTVYYYCYGDEN